MKRNIFIKGLAAVAVAGFLTGCSSDYLDLKPESNPSDKEVMQSTKTAALVINGICRSMYAQYQSTSWNQFIGEAYINTLIDDANGQDYISGLYGAMMGNDIANATGWDNTSLILYTAPWMYYYNLINQCNKVLDAWDGQIVGPEEERAFIKAQALTLRAHAYSKLVAFFGPRWVDSNEGNTYCLVLRTTSSVENVPLATMKDAMDLIYSDLNTALGLYDEAAGVQREAKFAPDKNIAHGIFARAALLKNDWPTAQEQAKAAREGYEIMDNDTYLSGFYKDNNDFMWTSSDIESDYYYWSFGAHYAANGLYVQNWGVGAGAIDINLYRQLDPNDIRCQCYLTPDKIAKLVSVNRYWNPGKVTEADWWNAHLVDASKDCNLKVGPFVASQAGEDGKWGLYNIALRYSWYYYNNIFTGEKSDIPLESGFELYYTAADKGDMLIEIKNDKPVYGTLVTIPFGAQYKFLSRAQYGAGSYPYMRAAEMCLIEAEAAYHNNDITTAQSCINEINGKRIPGYTCTKTGEDLLNEIRLCRRIELWGEGHSFTDFKRWNLPIDRQAWEEGNPNSGNRMKERSGLTETSANFGWRFLIPRSESNYNTEIDRSQLGTL